MKIIIIGNGIIALSTAYKIAKRASSADELYIIGNNKRTGSATLAAPAMLNSYCEIGINTLSSKIDLFRFELSQKATDSWPDLLSDLYNISRDKIINEYTKGQTYGFGTYLINNTASDSLDDDNFNAIKDALNTYGEEFISVDPKEIPNYNPSQRNRANRAILIPKEGWVNPFTIINCLEQRLKDYENVHFIDKNVKKIEESHGEIQQVILEDGINCIGDKYLLATGASVSDLLIESKVDLIIPRIFYGVGVSVMIESKEYAQKNCIRTPNRGLACGIYTTPYCDNNLQSTVIGATNLVSPTPIKNARVISVQSLLKSAMEQINKNFYNAEIKKINIGWRPTSADTYPLIGQTSIPNLIICTGTKRDGIHLSPVISDVICSILKGESIDERYSYFSPERDLIRTLNREDAIKDIVNHMISAAYQHGYDPGHIPISKQLIEYYKNDVERLHDKVGAIDWGIPPELVEMYRYGHIT